MVIPKDVPGEMLKFYRDGNMGKIAEGVEKIYRLNPVLPISLMTTFAVLSLCLSQDIITRDALRSLANRVVHIIRGSQQARDTNQGQRARRSASPEQNVQRISRSRQ